MKGVCSWLSSISCSEDLWPWTFIQTSWTLQHVSEGVLFSKNVGERSTAKNYHHVSLLLVVSKVSEKLVTKRIADHLEKCGLFPDFQYGLGLLDQLHIFWQLYLIELLGLLIGLELLELYRLIYSRLLTGFGSWFSSQTYVLWNFRSDNWPYFFFSQQLTASGGSGWEVFSRISS